MQNNSKYAEKNKFAENLKSANVTYFLHFSAYAEKLFSAFLFSAICSRGFKFKAISHFRHNGFPSFV
jgi:hypothetical protein